MSAARHFAAPVLVALGLVTLGCSRRPAVAIPGAEAEETLPGPMSPALKAFLTAEDLDDLVGARQGIKALDDGDPAAVLSVIERGGPPQAVSNLLIHPTVIPADRRVATLL